jgi:hypothetical protein
MGNSDTGLAADVAESIGLYDKGKELSLVPVTDLQGEADDCNLG